jgi:AraC-like DNA-binding protein
MSPVPRWLIRSDPKRGSYTYATSPGFGHALLSQIVTDVFRTLDIAASVTCGGYFWTVNRGPVGLLSLEVEHGAQASRYAYNTRCMARAAKTRRAVRGQHAGFSDLFVPVVSHGKLVATLVAGPFALGHADGARVLSRWRALTGRQGNMGDPEFASYLATTLSCLVLDEGQAALFAELCTCLADLLAQQGDASALANRADELRVRLEPIRLPERTWQAVEAMVDERFSRVWVSAARAYALGLLGLGRSPDRVLVALTVSPPSGTDLVEQAIRRDSLQRAAVGLARETGEAIAGRVGDHGIVFLSSFGAHAERKIRELAEHVSSVARRRFGLALRCGTSSVPSFAVISQSYHRALGAAQTALTRDQPLVAATAGPEPATTPLSVLRRALARAIRERPELAAADFDRYIEAVAVASGHGLDAAAAHLSAGFERMAEPLLETGALDPKGHDVLSRTLSQTATSATTEAELFGAYRRAVGDLLLAVRRPTAARQDRSLRRATQLIHEHYGERLDIRRVARAAGFAPSYFSRLFKMREGVAHEKYVQNVRLERAKQQLLSSSLSVERIAENCGFGSPEYFFRLFKRVEGRTPTQYRASAQSRHRSGRRA